MDIDEDRLTMIHDLARRYAAELGADLCFEKTLDREASLSGADFVINTALAGGHDHEEDERALMTRHGYCRGLHPSEGTYYQYDLRMGVFA